MNFNIKAPFLWLASVLNEYFADNEPYEIIFGSVFLTLILSTLYSQLNHKVPLYIRAKKNFFKWVRKIPSVRSKIERENEKIRENLVEEFMKPVRDLAEYVTLPDTGLSREEILDITKQYLGVGEFDWTEGKQSGTVYNGNPELTSLMTEVYGMSAWTNPLHPDTFPGIRKMEAEVVRMSCNLFKGGPESVGCMTCGGSESIILACKAYRDYAREIKGISDPVMVVPVTAHAAFDKAAAMLDMHIRHVKVDPKTMKVDVAAMKSAICSRTCMLVGSAPQFPHGSVDDIPKIAELGLRYDIPVHVDACLGGFLVCFMKDAGYPLSVDFDFSVPGVTSISADTHKYGFAPKGSSVILYSEPKYRHYQWFSTADWPGGIYATSTISGSRAGGIVAACWAAMVHFGKNGYIDTTKQIIETTRYIVKGLKDVKGIKIIGDPEVSVIALASEDFNIYGLSDGMKERGWNLNALQFPQSIHLCCTFLHTQNGRADLFIKDIKEVTSELLANPEACKSGSAAMYGMAQSIPDRKIVHMITWSYLDSLYVTKNKA